MHLLESIFLATEQHLIRQHSILEINSSADDFGIYGRLYSTDNETASQMNVVINGMQPDAMLNIKSSRMKLVVNNVVKFNSLFIDIGLIFYRSVFFLWMVNLILV